MSTATFSDYLSAAEAASIIGVSKRRVLQIAEAGDLPSRRAGGAIWILRSAAECYQRRPRGPKPKARAK